MKLPWWCHHDYLLNVLWNVVCDYLNEEDGLLLTSQQRIALQERKWAPIFPFWEDWFGVPFERPPLKLPRDHFPLSRIWRLGFEIYYYEIKQKSGDWKRSRIYKNQLMMWKRGDFVYYRIYNHSHPKPHQSFVPHRVDGPADTKNDTWYLFDIQFPDSSTALRLINGHVLPIYWDKGLCFVVVHLRMVAERYLQLIWPNNNTALLGSDVLNRWNFYFMDGPERCVCSPRMGLRLSLNSQSSMPLSSVF